MVRLDAQSRVIYWHKSVKCGCGLVRYIVTVTVPELLPLAVDMRLQPAWPLRRVATGVATGQQDRVAEGSSSS